jgi:hypothetical protein
VTTFANISHLGWEVFAVFALAALTVMGCACLVLKYISRRKPPIKPPPLPE